MEFTKLILIAFFKMFRRKADLVAENISLRQQLTIYKRKHKRIPIRNSDRMFWILLSKIWSKWKSALIIVKPETVLRWHRQGFKLFWRLKSRKKPGRPKIDTEIRRLIRQLSKENSTWGVPHIKSELALLGYDVAESTVAKYMFKHPKPPSQTWRTFLKNHASDIVACDFLTAYTVTFRVYYVFIMLRHSDRKIVHFNITQTRRWNGHFSKSEKFFHSARYLDICYMITGQSFRPSFVTN